MDAKLVFWSAAWLDMGVMVWFAGLAVSHARRGRVGPHRRAIAVAAVLILVFLLAYAVKLAVLGREDFSQWSRFDVNVLRFHESCVAVMLLVGAFAASRAWRMRRTRLVSGAPDAPKTPPGTLRWHRRAGRVAVAAALFAWISAGVVLLGMAQRGAG